MTYLDDIWYVGGARSEIVHAEFCVWQMHINPYSAGVWWPLMAQVTHFSTRSCLLVKPLRFKGYWNGILIIDWYNSQVDCLLIWSIVNHYRLSFSIRWYLQPLRLIWEYLCNLWPYSVICRKWHWARYRASRMLRVKCLICIIYAKICPEHFSGTVCPTWMIFGILVGLGQKVRMVTLMEVKGHQRSNGVKFVLWLPYLVKRSPNATWEWWWPWWRSIVIRGQMR